MAAAPVLPRVTTFVILIMILRTAFTMVSKDQTIYLAYADGSDNVPWQGLDRLVSRRFPQTLCIEVTCLTTSTS